jgi:hypothetical protein
MLRSRGVARQASAGQRGSHHAVNESADMRRLAGQAQDPFLALLMQAQAVYEEPFASRLPNYQPSDDRLWKAVIAFSGAVKAACTAGVPVP